jgi:hypothetical protein
MVIGGELPHNSRYDVNHKDSLDRLLLHTEKARNACVCFLTSLSRKIK